MELVIPAMIVLIGNLFSGSRGSLRWENVTAFFGWTAGTVFLLWLVGMFLLPEFWTREILFPIWAFCLLQALTRDYEKILKPVVDRWFKRGGRHP